MAREATVQAVLTIVKSNINYQSRPNVFTADVTNAGGPTPGMLNVTVEGENVDFSLLTRPGLCRIMNYGRADGVTDANAYVKVGIHVGSLFHSLLELLPGESFVMRLSRDLGQEESATGTGTTAPLNNLFLQAESATQNVLVEAFEA